MSVPDPPGIARHAGLPALRLFLGAAAEELRVVPVELSMLTIGRRPYNDLPLDDLTVSGEHAMLRRRNSEFVIYDLNSRNGTLVNGLPIQHRVLADGDVIDIGIYRLRFEAAMPASGGAPLPDDSDRPPALEPESSSAVADPSVDRESSPFGAERRSFERRTAERRSTDRRTSATDRDASAALGGTAETGPTSGGAADADSAGGPWASIEHLNGPQAGQRQLLERTINRIGGAAAQVAVISRRKGGFFITHLEGLTFPQVNGELLGLDAHRLFDGDLIEMSGAMLRFRLGS